MELHKKDFGKLGEAAVIQQSLEHGCAVFVEFGDNSVVDLILQTSIGLQRVQVKMVSRSLNDQNATKLLLYKNGPGYRFKYSSTDVDWFAGVDATTKKIAWVSAARCDTNSSLTLRHEVPKRIKSGFEMFDDYTTFPF